MLKITITKLSDASSSNPMAFDGILELMKTTIDDGEIIEVTGNETVILKTQEELDKFVERFK